jgi:hypothetical protein
MALALFDRIQETSTTTGTGPLTLTGAVLGYRTFLSVNTGALQDQHYYTITDQTASADWEVGFGEYDVPTNTFTRTTVLSSSNAGALVNFTSGALYIFATYPAGRAVFVNSFGQIVTNGATPAVLEIANGGTNSNTITKAFATIKGFFTNSSGATITLSDGSEYYQLLTGAAASTVRLPNPLSGAVSNGAAFCIINNGTVASTIRNSTGATTFVTVPPGVAVECVLVNGSINTAASWKFNWWFPQASTTGSVLLTSPTLAAGLATAARAPLKYTSGTNLTTVEAGAKEYDGVVFFATPNTTSGRAYQPSTHIFRLAANGAAIGPAIANFFGATSAINLVANGFYEIEAHCYFLKTTADIVTVTVTTSVAPLNLNGNIQTGAVTGGTATGAAQQIALFNSTATGSAFGATGTLTTGVNHYMKISLIVDAAASNSNLRINFTSGSGTVTPLRGSYYKTTRLPAANTGIFAA